MVYTLDVKWRQSSVSLYPSNFPNVSMIHVDFPSLVYLAVGVRTRSSSPKMWYIERLNSLNTLTEHNESTNTWFGLTEQHDRGHVTPNKFPGPHKLDIKNRFIEILSFYRFNEVQYSGSAQ